MNVSILQENLSKALSRTNRILVARPQLPILQNVLLVTKEGRLQVVITNLETSETVWVGAKIEKEGGICVPSRTLTELAGTLPQETVHLVVSEGSLKIMCGGVRATIPGVPATEFPPLAFAKKEGKVTFEKDALCKILSKVLFAAATDEGRPVLTGVRFEKSKGEDLLVAATDGYRLSLVRMPFPGKGALDMIVPGRALGEVLKIATEEKELATIEMVRTEEGQLQFVIGDTEVTTRAISGQYPDFEKIVPQKHTTRVLLEKEALLKAVKSAAIFARDNANIVRFTISGQALIVSSETPQSGENRVEIETKVDGEGGEISFNSRFVLELLTNTPESELLFEMTGSLNPGAFRAVKDSSFLHIIMPVRVQKAP